MLELGFVRENLELVKRKMVERGMPDVLADFETLDRERRDALKRDQTLKESQNRLADEISRRKHQGEDVSALIARMREEKLVIKRSVDDLARQTKERDEKLYELLRNVPNIPHESVPVGLTSQDNQEIRRWGEPRQFDFEPKAHWDL